MHDGVKLALFHAGTALDTLLLVDNIRLFDFALDRADRADAGAQAASAAFCGIDGVTHERLADA